MVPGSARGTQAPARRRWIRLVLVLSLGLNLLLLGVMAGYRWRHWLSVPLPPSERLIDHVVNNVPPPARKALRNALDDQRPALLAALGALRQAIATKQEALDTEPLDTARLAAAYAVVRQKLMALHTVIGEAAVDAAGKLSPTVRHDLSRHHRGIY